MTCKPRDSISLYFPNSGIEVAPTESDIRDKRRKYAAGEFRLPRKAGDLVVESVPDGSPVEVRIGGKPARRMLYRGDSLTYERTMDGTDVADVMLYDPTRILQKGSITKRFRDVSLRTVVEYIYDQVDDRYGVLRGLKFEEPDEADQVREVRGFAGGTEFLLKDTDIPYAQEGARFIDQAFESLNSQLHYETFTGFEFISETPLEALNKTVQEFAVEYWVDIDGILHIGLSGVGSQVVAVKADSEAIKLSRYAVTTDPDQINSVYLEGTYRFLEANTNRGSAGANEDGIIAMAEVTDPTSSGTQLTGEVERGLTTLKALEDAATRQLIQEMTSRANGSIEVNALASEDKEALRKLDIGDIFLIDDSISLRCDDELMTGPFLVTGIDHKSNDRQGWTISLDVSRIPNLSELEKRSVIYVPSKNKTYESFEHFAEDFDKE